MGEMEKQKKRARWVSYLSTEKGTSRKENVATCEKLVNHCLSNLFDKELHLEASNKSKMIEQLGSQTCCYFALVHNLIWKEYIKRYGEELGQIPRETPEQSVVLGLLVVKWDSALCYSCAMRAAF